LFAPELFYGQKDWIMSNLTDEKLLKRAGHAGTNLFVLACLATLGALLMLALGITVVGKGNDGPGPVLMMVSMGMAIGLVAISYWFLAVAARRGNPNAVGVVIIAMGVQIALTLIASGVGAARNNSEFRPNVASLFIPIVILVALTSSRKVLLELQERGLWIQAFGQAKPSRQLCVVGAVVLSMGLLSLNAVSVYTVEKIQQRHTVELRHARAFVAMIQNDERDFFAAMHGLSGSHGQSDVEPALAKLNALEQNLESIIKDTAPAEPMLPILNSYASAVRQWKNGLQLLVSITPDPDRAQKMLELGDKLRGEATREFDRRYAPRETP
jgi:hypothetical protein